VSGFKLISKLYTHFLGREPGYIAISPILLNNLAANQHTPQSLTVLQSPFGQKIPPVPTARSITLARIATPISIHRRYQPVVLHALRQHFQTSRRLLKKDDLIALPISTASSILLDGLSESDGKTVASPEELLAQ
jgi:peroxin-6